MFSNVWSWAGEFRQSNKNIGIDFFNISVELKNLLDDCFYWHEKSIFSDKEIAIRLKHRIVKIHCFPNGNGRHSRLLADLFMEKIYSQSFLKKANLDYYKDLINFVD